MDLSNRLLGITTLPDLMGWAITLGLLVGYAAIALPLGFMTGFLKIQPWQPGGSHHYALLALRLFFFPSVVEELIFRVLPLPYPGGEAFDGTTWAIWAAISLVIFTACHPLNALTVYRAAYPTFLDPTFLTLAALLGLACTLLYWLTASLLAIVLLHWVIVLVWLIGCGGMERLGGKV